MGKTTLLVRCDKDNHAGDTKFASHLMMTNGVADVIETFVRVGGKEYCMIVESYSDKKSVKKLEETLRKDSNVRFVLRAKEQQVPI
ncbi:MAG: hypothetical protein KGH66_03085 [Candidatus Micrarchaeota archaeon]|nr:hypothetical protein [Candidatus Micrarchaeota archaeon]